MRVALRRLRSAMTLFAPLTGTTEGRRLKAEIKWLAGTLGQARDLDVFLDDVLGPADQGLGDAPGLAALTMHVTQARDAAYTDAFAAAGGARAGALLLDLALWLEDDAWPTEGTAALPVRDLACSTLDQSAGKVLRKGRHFGRLDADRRHRLRIEAKKLRYAVDFFAPLFKARQAKPYRKALATLQDVLGGLNDVVVAQALLRDIGTGTGPAARGGGGRRDVAFAAGMVAGWHHAASLGQSSDATAAWNGFLKAKPFWT